MKPTVRQHYVPACYLARFTINGTRYSPFFAHFLNGTVKELTPESIGFERHYHTVKAEGFKPDHLEGVFQNIESPACSLFKDLSENAGRSLTRAELDTLLLFFSLQAARVPQSRAKYGELMVRSAQAFMEEMAHSARFYERVTAIGARHGVEIDSMKQEGLRATVEGGSIVPQVDKNQSAVGMFRVAEAILYAIDGMHYTLWYSDGTASFVCSDYPVGLFYSLSAWDALKDPMGVETPTVTMLFDTIYMPLAHNVAVVIHKHEQVPTAQRANERMVAIVNSVTISHAQRFICTATEDFICVLPGGELGNAKRALETLMSFASDTDEEVRICNPCREPRRQPGARRATI